MLNERWNKMVKQYKSGEMEKEYDEDRGGWVLPCSTSEQLMIALATGHRDLLRGWDGFDAFFKRLNDEQREIVKHYRNL